MSLSAANSSLSVVRMGLQTGLSLVRITVSCAGVKSLRVLAFTSQFALLLHYLEQVLAADNTIQQLLQTQQETQGNKVGGVAARTYICGQIHAQVERSLHV